MKLQITSLLVAALSLSPLISFAQEKAPAAPAAAPAGNEEALVKAITDEVIRQMQKS